MIDREWIDLLRILHGAFNTLVAVAFFYQGSLGLKVRKGWRSGKGDFRAIRRHRGNGPILALLGVLGYVAGTVLITLDKGHFFEYYLHHFVGLSIVILLTSTFLVSRKIKGPDSPWRTPHLLLGMAILGAYLIQLFLGLNILL